MRTSALVMGLAMLLTAYPVISPGADTMNRRISVTLVDNPNLPPLVLKKNVNYDISWGNLGQTMSTRWVDDSTLEMTAIIGDFTLSINTGAYPLSARVREAGRVKMTFVVDAEIVMTASGPRVMSRTESARFDISYDIFDVIPGRKDFFEVYMLRLQRSVTPRDINASPAEPGTDQPDFFLPAKRTARVRVRQDGLQIQLLQPGMPVNIKNPHEEAVRTAIVLPRPKSP